jgi:dTDP-4-dehydrorhamnose reductase
MKILLFGKNGQVGWELQRSLAPLGTLVALDRNSTDFCGDLSDLDGIRNTVIAVDPDIIVNAAAYTAVDKAEAEPELAHLINSTAPAVMAEMAQKLDALLVHYSTDYVFNGAGDLAWGEDSTVAPLNEYGRSKLSGELAIIKSRCNYLIFRTSWVYAVRGNNFIKTILRLARTQSQLNVINDQFGAPTGADLIADVSAQVIAVCHDKPVREIYHLAASGVTTWYEYAKFIINFAVQKQQVLQVSQDNVTSVTSAAFKTAAVRPFNSRLNTNKLSQTFKLQSPAWQIGVQRALTELLERH